MEKRSAKERAPKKGPEHKTAEGNRAKEALLESEALYKHLADALPDPVVILQDDRYQFVNPAFTRVFGYTRQDLDRGLSFLETIQEQDKKAARQRYKDRLAGKQLPKTNTIDLIAKDGTLVPCETSATMIQYQGRPADLVVIRDITERKQAEEALHKSEERYRSLFENMAEGFAYCKIILDVTGRPVDFEYLDINKAFENLTGLKREDVLDRRVTDAIPGIRESHPELFEIYGNVALTGEATAFELFFEPLRIWLSISVYCPHEGHFVAVFDNITERKRAEEALRESEEKFRQLVSTTTDAIMLFDAETRRFLEVNKACEDLYGYNREEFLKLKHSDITAEPGKSEDSIKRTLEGKLDRIDARYHKKKDGTVFPVEISASTFQARDRRVLCGVVRDITERKQAEEALRETTDELRAE